MTLKNFYTVMQSNSVHVGNLGYDKKHRNVSKLAEKI